MYSVTTLNEFFCDLATNPATYASIILVINQSVECCVNMRTDLGADLGCAFMVLLFLILNIKHKRATMGIGLRPLSPHLTL